MNLENPQMILKKKTKCWRWGNGSVGETPCYSTMRAWVQIPVTHVKSMRDHPNPQPPDRDAIVSFNLREPSSLNCLKAIRWKMIQQDPRRMSSLGLCMCVHGHNHLYPSHTHTHTKKDIKENEKFKIPCFPPGQSRLLQALLCDGVLSFAVHHQALQQDDQ